MVNHYNEERPRRRRDDRANLDEEWRRFDEDRDFSNRPGALDRRWGYGPRLAPGYEQERGLPAREAPYGYEDYYNAPDYWTYQEEWMRPGPFTGVGPRNYSGPATRSDEEIFEDVCDRLAQHAQIDASQIEVKVEDGEVTLAGTVDSRRTKRMAEYNIEMVPGVIDVHNRLRLEGLSGRGQEKKEEQPLDNPFPGGPAPTGNAGFSEEDRS